MYLKNMWYVAGFPDEIGDHPIARTLLEQPLVFFRARGGQIAALADRCPHRFAPLSKGVKVSGEPTIAAFDVHLREQGKATEQWSEVTWTAAGNMHLRTGATLLGEERSQGVEAMTLHLATPETATSAHYWYWSIRNFAISPEANSQIQKFIEFAFVQQDKPMLEAQQRAMQGREFWSLRPILLASDAGAVRARRKLDQLVQAEHGIAPSSVESKNPATSAT